MEHYYYYIDGWFNFQEPYSYAAKIFPDNSVFVEIGCWKGKSTTYLGVELINSNKNNTKLFCIDTWGENDDGEYDNELSLQNKTLYDEFLRNIKPLQDNKLEIISIKDRSDNAYKTFDDNSIDFLYIDGSHLYENVKKDIELYFPKMKPNSIMAGHDWQSEDVVRAVEEFFGKNKVTLNLNTWMMPIKK